MDAYNYVFAEMNHPRRTYHNISHINKMLAGALQYGYESACLNNGRIHWSLYEAIVFHDFVYEVPCPTGDMTNEKQSAGAYARFALLHTDHGQAAIDVVADLIKATEHHFDGTEYPDYRTNLLLDLDLLSFADDYDDFAKTQILIDNEFLPYYDEKEVREKRYAFLQSILDNKSLQYRVIDPTGTLTKRAYENIACYLYIHTGKN